MIPFLRLTPGEDAAAVREAIDRVVQRGWFVLGPELERFEREFADASRARYTIGVGTGTDALAIALRALDIGPGDEVITAPLSAAYSALAIMMVGARPVFADIDPDRLTLDPRAVAAAITPRTMAIMPVHLYGQAADMRAITRSLTLDAPVSATVIVAEIAEDLVRAALAEHPREKIITLLAVSVSHIGKQPHIQLELPLGLGDEKHRPGTRQGIARWSADRAMDKARTRFGRDAIGYAITQLERRKSVPDAFRELAEKSLSQ